MGAAEVVGALSPTGDKTGLTLRTNGCQIRELARLSDAELRRKAWKEVQNLASGGEITSAMVRKAVEKIAPSQESSNRRSQNPKQEPKNIRLTATEVAEIRRVLKKMRSIVKDSPQALEISDLTGKIDDILQR